MIERVLQTLAIAIAIVVMLSPLFATIMLLTVPGWHLP